MDKHYFDGELDEVSIIDSRASNAMHPSRPTSTDPNAPYRAAIAALGGHPGNAQEVAQGQAAPNAYQQSGHDGFPARRHTNRDRLNAIAHNLGSGVRIVMERMAAENAAGPSHPTEALTIPQPSYATIDTLRDYFDRLGIGYSSRLQDETIQFRLDSANLSVEALIAAVDIVRTPNHPTLIAFQVSENERYVMMKSLTKCMEWRGGFDQRIRDAALNANNDPHALVSNILFQMRHVR